MFRSMIWRAVATVLMCGALALPAQAQGTSDTTNASSMSTMNANATGGSMANASSEQGMSNTQSASAQTSGGLSSGAAQGGGLSTASDTSSGATDHSTMWTIGMIALAVIVVGAIIWAASGRDYEPRPMTRA